MSPFSWRCQNLCRWHSLALMVDRRVVTYFYACSIFRSWVSPRPVSLPPFPWSRNASRVWLRRLTSRGHSTQPTNIHTWREQTKHTFRHHPKLHITIYKKEHPAWKITNNVIQYSRDYCLVREKLIPRSTPRCTYWIPLPMEGISYEIYLKLFCLQTIHYIWVLTIKTRSK